MKEAGFVRADRNGVALPDWGRFEEEPKVATVVAGLVRDGLASEIVARPPRLQVATETGLGWQEVAASEAPAAILRSLRRVRNNLFHGGKSGPDPRDNLLCEEAVVCLLALLAADTGVEAAFDGRY